MKLMQDRFVSGGIIVALSVALAHLSVSTSYGAPVSVTMSASASTIGSTTFSTAGPPPPGGSLSLRGNVTSIEFEPPEPGDIQDLIEFDPNAPPAAAWIIREEDAPSFGFDWGLFEQNLIGLRAAISLRFLNGNIGTTAVTSIGFAVLDPAVDLPLNAYLATFEMDEIQVFVDYYYFHELIPTLRATKIGFQITGSGEVVPEPGICMLMLIGVSVCPVLFRRR